MIIFLNKDVVQVQVLLFRLTFPGGACSVDRSRPTPWQVLMNMVANDHRVEYTHTKIAVHI